jgi:hypothetical protein
LAATTAYHPQEDGQTELVNQELEQYLLLFLNQCQDDWDGLLPLAEFQYNNHVHSSTQQPPFLLNTGRVPRMLENNEGLGIKSNSKVIIFDNHLASIYYHVCEAIRLNVAKWK